MKFLAAALLVALRASEAFQVPLLAKESRSLSSKALSQSLTSTPLFAFKPNKEDQQRASMRSGLKRILNRANAIELSGLVDVKVNGLGDNIKNLHGPKTYLLLALAAGLKWNWCFRNPYFWFGVAFCVKWYRARYVFKIPVWDRQPNWNNIITSKDQEKDLKAFTCLNCGSTLFIAKTREFFFEGDTGIGGLGCFSCGAKGKENFVMDRDRIIEDVADVDDYFEYERPLDFVSRAERRKLMNEAGGDEEKANEILKARAGPETESKTATPPPSEQVVPGDVTSNVDGSVEEAPAEHSNDQEIASEETLGEPVVQKASVEGSPVQGLKGIPAETEKKASSEEVKTPSSKKAKPSAANDDLDVLDMDS